MKDRRHTITRNGTSAGYVYLTYSPATDFGLAYGGAAEEDVKTFNYTATGAVPELNDILTDSIDGTNVFRVTLVQNFDSDSPSVQGRMVATD